MWRVGVGATALLIAGLGAFVAYVAWNSPVCLLASDTITCLIATNEERK